MDRGRSKEHRRALPLPKRRRPQLAPGHLRVAVGHRLQRPNGGRGDGSTSSRIERLARSRKAGTYERNKRKAYRDYWWQFGEKRPAMRKAIAKLDEVLVITLVSKTVMPMRVLQARSSSQQLGVFATDSFADQAVLSSSLHQMWAIKYGARMRNDPSYTPSDVFDTFPRPEPTERLAEIGRTLDTERREIMLRRDLGLTKLYNLVNDPDIADCRGRRMSRGCGRSTSNSTMQSWMPTAGVTCRLTTGSTPTGRCGGGRSARPRGWRSWTGCWPRTSSGPRPRARRRRRAEDEEEGDEE